MIGWVSWAEGKLDGKAQYELYCGACHGVDGKGATGGQFPPLAGSNWVEGGHARMTQVVLHGLQGEITVNTPDAGEKEYNLVMPPQGGALTDAQIAAIATYVRSAWGNKGGEVTEKMVAAEREKTKARSEMWTAAQILGEYPLQGQGLGKIENLIALVYEGRFKSLEDLRKAEPVTAEEEKGGLISLGHAGDRKDGFGVVWKGEIYAPKKARYEFELDSDDGSAVFINGKKVVELANVGGLGRMTKGGVVLEKGRHEIRVEFFELRGDQGIVLRWRAPKMKPVYLSDTKAQQQKKKYPPIPLAPESGQAVIYRNFVDGSTARAINVGYARGLNLTFSADNMTVEQVWAGDFIDAGRHWTNRGQGNTSPLGNAVSLTKGPAFAVLADENAKWPESYQPELSPRFRGYELKNKKQPLFTYDLGNLRVKDYPEPKGGEKIPGLARRFRIEAGEDAPKTIYFRICQGHLVKDVGSRGFRVGDRLFVQVGGRSAGKPVLRGEELILPIHLKAGTNKFVLNYTLD